MAGRARVASYLTSGKGRIPEDAGGYNACSLSRSQLPPVLSVGLRQRSIKAQGVAVGVGGQLVAQDDTTEPITKAAMIKAMDVLMAPPLPPASAAAPPAAPSWATSGLRLHFVFRHVRFSYIPIDHSGTWPCPIYGQDHRVIRRHLDAHVQLMRQAIEVTETLRAC